MVAKHAKQCFCCGNEYSYCPTCYEDRLKPSWYSMFDSEKCKELNAILSSHSCGRINDKTAKEQIENLNIDISIIKNDLNREYIKKILAKNTTKKQPKNTKKVVDSNCTIDDITSLEESETIKE